MLFSKNSPAAMDKVPRNEDAESGGLCSRKQTFPELSIHYVSTQPELYLKRSLGNLTLIGKALDSQDERETGSPTSTQDP